MHISVFVIFRFLSVQEI